jgi:hypothetical protein
MSVCVVALLSACGGGGGDDAAATTDTGTPTARSDDTSTSTSNDANPTGLFRSWELVTETAGLEEEITSSLGSDFDLDLNLDLTGGDFDVAIPVRYTLKDFEELGSCYCDIALVISQ